MPFDSRLLVNEPNCLERIIYEAIADHRNVDIESTNLIECLMERHKLNADYVFTSQYSVSKRCHGKPLLYLAIMYDRADIVDVLLNHEIGGSDGYSQNIFAIESSTKEDPFKRTALFQSLSTSSDVVFNMLIHAPMICYARDACQRSLLWHAVSLARNDKVYAILNSCYGPELVNAPDQNGTRPLHVAVINNDSVAAEMLLSNGAHVDAVQSEGITALCLAAKRGAVSILKTLLKHGANSNFLPSEKTFSEREPSCDATVEYYRKNNITNSPAMKSPAVLAVLTQVPFRKTPEQICLALSVLVACGAKVPHSFALPSFLPQSLILQCRQPVSLQMLSTLAVRKCLIASSGGRSIKLLLPQLATIIPSSLVNFLLFDFLSQM